MGSGGAGPVAPGPGQWDTPLLLRGAAPWGGRRLQTVQSASVPQPHEWSLLYWGEIYVTEAVLGSSVRAGVAAGTLPCLGSHRHRSGLFLFASRSALTHLACWNLILGGTQAGRPVSGTSSGAT